MIARYQTRSDFVLVSAMAAAALAFALVVLLVGGFLAALPVLMIALLLGGLAWSSRGKAIVRVMLREDETLAFSTHTRTEPFPLAALVRIERFARSSTSSTGGDRVSYYVRFVLKASADETTSRRIRLTTPETPSLDALVREVESRRPTVETGRYWGWRSAYEGQPGGVRKGSERFRRDGE